MAKMNWDRVRTESNGQRYGYERAIETYSPTKKATKKKKKLKGKKRQGPTIALRPTAELGHLSKKEAKRIAHQRLMEIAAKNKAAKAANRTAQLALESMARLQRKKKKEERLALVAKRVADSPIQINQTKQKPWMRSIVVVKRVGSRETVLRTGIATHSPSPRKID